MSDYERGYRDGYRDGQRDAREGVGAPDGTKPRRAPVPVCPRTGRPVASCTCDACEMPYGP